MTNRRPAFNLDTLAAATIAYYITSAATDDARLAYADFDDDSMTDMIIDELAENQSIFDLFIDAANYDSNDIDALTDAEFHYTDEFREIILTATRDHRAFIDSLPR